MSEKKLLFVLLLLGFYTSAQIKGVVKDSISGEPIPYVNIWVENETIGTTSEIDGSFQLASPLDKNIVFAILGYKKKDAQSQSNRNSFIKPYHF